MSLTHEYHNGNRICCNIFKADIELVKLWRKLSAGKTFNEERYKIWTLDWTIDAIMDSIVGKILIPWTRRHMHCKGLM